MKDLPKHPRQSAAELKFSAEDLEQRLAQLSPEVLEVLRFTGQGAYSRENVSQRKEPIGCTGFGPIFNDVPSWAVPVIKSRKRTP